MPATSRNLFDVVRPRHEPKSRRYHHRNPRPYETNVRRDLATKSHNGDRSPISGIKRVQEPDCILRIILPYRSNSDLRLQNQPLGDQQLELRQSSER
jgi:hypothetical protein